ncbi:hypothetical protein JDV02_008071 [Purpureocillium takamizusanense]|uniref:Uncharacterized protein n=1 Tax=Purpureocillium takamizusanense TaxID=2060973 RepID=A0A9Q8QNY7_9HYPO|nr:uncharacterized protein JDV02_008071 [Purpureocillium takamizusanense]UNI22154.1 hypothetical protein JDV02_008071 [Purpureocillium takamizusanense]
MVKFTLSMVALCGAVSALPGVDPALARRSLLDPSDFTIVPSKSSPQGYFKAYKTGGLKRYGAKTDNDHEIVKRWTCDTSSTYTSGDNDNGGKGISIRNTAPDKQCYYLIHNSCDKVPWKHICVDSGDTRFVSFPDRWEGRIQRGVDQYMLGGQPQWLGSWFEVSWDQNGWGWADLSLIRGNDGGVVLTSADGSNARKGYSQWVLDGAPGDAYDQKADGVRVIAATERLDGSINTAARDWNLNKVGAENAYCDDYHGNPVIAATNGRFSTEWPAGRP